MGHAVREIVHIIGDIAGRWRQSSIDLAKIEASIYYIKGVRIARFIVLGIIGLCLTLILFLTGWGLLHYALIALIPWEPGTLPYVVGALAVLNLLVAFGAFFAVLSEKRWMSLTHSDHVVDDAT